MSRSSAPSASTALGKSAYHSAGGRFEVTMVAAHALADELGDLQYESIQLCAIIASATLRRIPTEPVARRALAGSGEIEILEGRRLRAFLLPIFEESGIAEQFELRTGYEVYPKAQAVAV